MRGPFARIVATGSQRSPSTIPRISPVADRHDIRRTMGSRHSFSILSGGPRTERYATLLDRVNLLRPHYAGANARRLDRADAARTHRSRRHPPWLRGRVDRRPVLGRGRRRRRSPRSDTPGNSASAPSTRRRCTATAPRNDGWARRCAMRPRDAFVLSTKVGRLVRDEAAIPGDADIDRQRLDGVDDAFYVRRQPVRLGLRLQRRRGPTLAGGEPRAAGSRSDRHRVHPRSGRPLAGGDRGGVAGARAAPRRGRDPAPSGPA